MALAAISGLGLSAGAEGITIFWPAAGVAAALVTTAPQRLRRNVLTGVFLGTVLSAIPMGGDKWAFILGAAIANTVEAHIAGKILRGRLPEAHRIVRVSDIRALFKAGVLGPAAGAVIGGTATAITFNIPFGGAAPFLVRGRRARNRPDRARGHCDRFGLPRSHPREEVDSDPPLRVGHCRRADAH
ncbi:MAG: hypothetical protein LC739_06810, partial [Actinobacteria bacterium]|nr:hypothetical protein [Actinomycetota bacterium]